MATSKTNREDYLSWRKEYEEIAKRSRLGSLTNEDSDREVNLLWEKYKRRVSQEDFYYFCDERSFRDSLLNLRLPSTEVTKILEHERAHFHEAKRLGFDPRYGYVLLMDEGKLSIHPFVDFETTDINLTRGRNLERDIRRIAHAPDELSEWDKRID